MFLDDKRVRSWVLSLEVEQFYCKILQKTSDFSSDVSKKSQSEADHSSKLFQVDAILRRP